MPVLSNPKHERFAQELAAGKSASEAYAHAGYAPNPKNAPRLKANEGILRRVSELLAERESVHQQATAAAVEKVALSKEWVLGQLVENVSKAKDNADFGPANKALELLGKELGMFIDRKEVRKGSLDGLNADDRKELREAIERELASRSGGTQSSGQLQ